MKASYGGRNGAAAADMVAGLLDDFEAPLSDAAACDRGAPPAAVGVFAAIFAAWKSKALVCEWSINAEEKSEDSPARSMWAGFSGMRATVQPSR
jgi:hypothetical protein